MRPKPSGQGLVVLGAGLAGLSTAYHAGSGTRVFEAEPIIGGTSATDEVRGYQFDRAGHLLHAQQRATLKLIEELLPGQWNRVVRDARIRLAGQELRYPIQSNTFGLTPELKAECLRTYLLAATAAFPAAPQDFLSWARSQFGSELTRIFFEPYNRKLWTIPPQQLTLEWLGPYVPRPAAYRVIQGAFSDQPQGGGYNAVFHYPKRGGIWQLAQALAWAAMERGADLIAMQARVTRVDPRRRVIQAQNWGEQSWKRLVSTLPLPELVKCLVRPPRKILEAARQLKHNSVLVMNFGLKSKSASQAHWIYFPEKEFSFYRVGFPTNYGRVAPRGCSTLFAEIAFPADQGWSERRQIARSVRQQLNTAGYLPSLQAIELEHLQYLKYAYVIFDREHANARRTILDYLEHHGIQSIGRWGGWEYSAMEDALTAGRRAAHEV